MHVNPRGWPLKIDSQKQKEILYLLDTEHDAQYLTSQQLGIEFRVEAIEKMLDRAENQLYSNTFVND